jgi:hypothetical protein
VGHIARIEGSRNAHKILVRKPETKRPLGRRRHRCKDNNKMEYEDVCCNQLTQDRIQWRALVYTVMKRGVPEKEGYYMAT